MDNKQEKQQEVLEARENMQISIQQKQEGHGKGGEEEEEEQFEGKWQKIEQPQRKVGLFMVDFQQCDSKKCTGKKMQRFKLLNAIKDHKKKFKGIVLSAFGKKLVSKEDMEYCQKYGICVIDCSWNRIEETREYRYKHERKLPFVVAGNPTNYGKPYQLSCVEAIATALCSIGYVPHAKFIMSKFGWADGFWQQNPGLAQYSLCNNLDEMKIKSKQNEQCKSIGFERNYELPSDSEQQQVQKV